MATDDLGITPFEEQQIQALKLGATQDEVASVGRTALQDTPYIAPQGTEGLLMDEPTVVPDDYQELTEVERAIERMTGPGSETAKAKSRVDTAINQMSRGFAETNPLTTNLIDWASTKVPSLAGRLYVGDEKYGTGWISADELFGEGFSDPMVTDDARRTAIQEKRAGEIQSYYENVSTDTAAYTLGQFGGAIADPTTVIPFGSGIGAALKGGALLGGIDAAAMDLAKTGEVDPAHVAIGVGLGAGLGVAFEAALVAPITRMMAARKDAGVKFTSKSVKEALPDNMKNRVDTEELAARVNASMDDMTPEVRMAIAERTGPLGEADSIAYWQGKAAETADSTVPTKQIWQGQAALSPRKNYLSEAKFVTEMKKLSASTGKLNRGERKELTKLKKELEYDLAQPGGQRLADPSLKKKKKLVKKGERAAQKAQEAPQKALRAQDRKYRDQLESRLKGVQSRLDSDSVARGTLKEIPEATLTFGEMTPITVDGPGHAIQRRMEAEAGDEIFDSLVTPEMAGMVVAGRSVDGPMSIAQAGDRLDTTKQTAKEAIEEGNIAADSHVGRTMLPDSSTMDPLITLDEKSHLNLAQKFTNGMMSFRPWKRFEAHGGAGQEFAYYIRQAWEATQTSVGRAMDDVTGALRKAGIRDMSGEDALTVVNILKKTVKQADQPKHLQVAAVAVRKKLTRVLIEAREAGIYSKERFDELSAKMKDKGYFPRLYNEDKIQSAEGEREWVEALTGFAFKNEQSAKIALKALAGDDKVYSAFKTLLRKDGSKYIVSKELANSLYRHRLQSAPTRSSHLDHARKIPEEFEEALAPFLYTDPEVVLSKYFQDVYTRIEHAKRFGNKDERLIDLTSRMEAAGHKDIAEDMTQVYFNAVRDPRGKNVRSFYERKELTKKVVGSLKSFTSLKLILAQTLNLAQAPTNGTALLTGLPGVNPLKAYGIAVDSIMKGASGTAHAATGGRMGSAELSRAQNRVGANNATMMLQYAGDINQAYHTIAQREFTGIFAPFNILNNPAKFLKATGFFTVEDFNRRVATQMGMGAVDHVRAEKLLLLNKAVHTPLNKRELGRMKDFDDTLTWFGLDTQVHPDSYKVKQLQWAYARFSDEANFINAAHTLPLSISGFYGKLLTQFKSFAIHATGYVADNVIGPAKRGNLVPLATYMGVGTPIGMTIDEFRRWIMADDKEFTLTERVVRGAMMASSAGITIDLAMNAYYKDTGLASALVGPALTDVSNVAHGIAKSVAESVKEGEIRLKPLAQAGLKAMVIPQEGKLKRMLEEKKGLDAELKTDFKTELSSEI